MSTILSCRPRFLSNCVISLVQQRHAYQVDIVDKYDRTCQRSIKIIDLVTVFDAILTSRQTREKLQCLYENLMSNNFRRTADLKKI